MPITKPSDVIDREAEWEALAGMWARPRPDLAFAVGRRRVGKSYVLARFARAVGGVYYQATRRTEAEQLAGLSRVVGEHFGDAALRRGVGFPAWEYLFDYVTERAGGQAFLLILDEFPYLAEAAPALPSILQRAWDHTWPETRMKVVLSGSYVTAMARLEEADQPLYGRRTLRLTFSPFGLPEAARFVPGWAARDQLLAYGLYGHLPGHLALLDPDRPLAANVAEHLLSPAGRLVDDAQHVLDAFLGEAGVHYSILEAIAGGSQTWSDITSRVGRSGGSLSRPLAWLEGMGLVERDVPVTEKRPDRSKRALYRVTDPYLTFWHRVVAPLVHAGSIGLAAPERLWEEVVEPRLDDHMGSVFESASRDFVRRAARGEAGQPPAGRLPFRPLRVGAWWDVRSRQEVDVVALGGRGEVLVGEAKWGPVTERHLRTLRQRAALVEAELGEVREVHLALFSGRGTFDDAVRAEADAGRVLLYTGDDLLAE
jgi:uncharacterized protein